MAWERAPSLYYILLTFREIEQYEVEDILLPTIEEWLTHCPTLKSVDVPGRHLDRRFYRMLRVGHHPVWSEMSAEVSTDKAIRQENVGLSSLIARSGPIASDFTLRNELECCVSGWLGDVAPHSSYDGLRMVERLFHFMKSIFSAHHQAVPSSAKIGSYVPLPSKHNIWPFPTCSKVPSLFSKTHDA